MSNIENVNVIYLNDHNAILQLGFPSFNVDPNLNNKQQVDDEINDQKINYDYDDETTIG